MRGLLIFVFGIIVGAAGLYYYQTHGLGDRPLAQPARQVENSGEDVAERTRDAGESAKDRVNDKVRDWHLTGGEIRDDLHRTGEVVRSKAEAAGQRIASATSNARIVAVIKAKYTLDKELSARTIDVSVQDGVVTLRGTAPSESLIGKAVAFALDTDGVVQVKSLLTVQANG